MSKTNNVSADEALALLRRGNQRYIDDVPRLPLGRPGRRYETSNGQWPFAIVLTCADSRVSPELIFDHGIGDLFVARVAGNIACDQVIGSIQYAVQYIKTELVVVLGHEACGAVGAAISPPTDAPAELGGLAAKIQGNIGREKDVARAVAKNANATAKQLRAKLKGAKLKHAKVVAATYGLRTGAVTWL